MTGAADRVLVVDDDRTIRAMLTDRLKAHNIGSEQAEDGETALRLLRGQPFDVVLLDVVIPGMTGLGVLRAIKADPTLSCVPVVMLSALGDIDNVVTCLEAGAEDYLPKPLDAHLLLARVDGILLRKRLRELEADDRDNVGRLAEFAAQLGVGTADPARLTGRPDGLGRLAQEFHRIARTVSPPEAP
jgi:DNA-binding response OmpR family regulator